MKLSAVRYDKSSTVMTPQEELYWMHFLEGDPLVGDYVRSQMRLNPRFRNDLLNQPVCSKCEKFAFHHKNGVMCPSCGTFTSEKTHKVKIHIAEGHYR